MSEESPLLTQSHAYDRFTSQRKSGVLALISCAGLFPFFVSGTFIPSIADIAYDFHSTAALVSLTISVSVLSSAFGMLFLASYAGYYGRRPTYLYALPMLSIGSIGVASSRHLPELMFFRIFQAFGSAGGMSLGAAVIGDVYKPEERGAAMGIFYGVSLLGPSLAPLSAGLMARYFSWRYMQYLLGISGVLLWISMYFYLPETSHSRDADKDTRTGFVWLNPLTCLRFLRKPNLGAVTVAAFLVLSTDFVFLVPFVYTIGAAYNITNPALVGACFIPSGVGNMVGARIAGPMSDRILLKWRARRGYDMPEDRLRVTIVSAGLLAPLSILFSGLLVAYVPGRLGLILNLVCLFLNGCGVTGVLSPCASYVVDSTQPRSAEAVAAHSGVRSILTALSVAAVMPLMETYGAVFTDTLSALLSWFGCFLLLLVIRYGKPQTSASRQP